MRGEMVAVVGIVAILMGAGVGYLAGNANERTVTSVSTYTATSVVTATFTATDLLTTTSTATTTATAPSLAIFGSVSPPSIASGQNVTLNFGVFNPLPTAITVNLSPFYDPYLTGCPVSGRPDAWGLFPGHVTFSNLSSAKSLLLYNASMPLLCFAGANSTFVFQPDSDVALVTAFNRTLTLTWDHTQNYSGYWVPSSNGDYRFEVFPPGQYTALFFDVWGQQLLEYFAVGP